METTSVGGNEKVLTKRGLTALDFDEDQQQQDVTVTEPRRPKNRRVTCVAPFSSDTTVRRSARISTYREIRKVKAASPMIIKKRARNMTDVISSYFDLSQTISKADHESTLLEMINKGALKELKMLPTVGPKTAYQIMSYRAVNGVFKNLSDLKKLPAMKGKSWDNFLEVSANIIFIQTSILIFFSFYLLKANMLK